MSPDRLAKKFKQYGMSAYSRLQQQEFDSETGQKQVYKCICKLVPSINDKKDIDIFGYKLEI